MDGRTSLVLRRGHRILFCVHVSVQIKKKGAGVEIFIPKCSSVKGCRFAVYKEAETKGARLITPRIKDAISSQGDGLSIKLGFESDAVSGEFVNAVRQWCEFHACPLGHDGVAFIDDVTLGRRVALSDYDENETNSPAGGRARSRSRSSEESFKTYVTEMVDPKSELCLFKVQFRGAHSFPSKPPTARELVNANLLKVSIIYCTSAWLLSRTWFFFVVSVDVSIFSKSKLCTPGQVHISNFHFNNNTLWSTLHPC